MAREDLPAGVKLRADRLGNAEDHAAGQRPPQAAEPADDHRLEGVEQPCRPDGGREVGADRHEGAGERHHRERQCHGEREDMAVVDAHQRRRLMVVRGRAEGHAEPGAEEQKLQARDYPERREEDDEREPTDGNLIADGDARRLQRAGLEPLCVG